MADSLRQTLNASNLQTVADALRLLGLGDLVRQSMNQAMRAAAPAASASQLATLQQLGLDVTGAPTSANGPPAAGTPIQGAGARAATVLWAYSRAGANAGQLAVIAYGATPATGQIAVAPNGDIVVLAADGHTVVDCDFSCQRGDYIKLLGQPVASSNYNLPTGVTNQGVLVLISASANTGTVTGSKVVLVPSNTPGSTGQARLSITKAQVLFATADAVATCDVELLLVSAKNMDGLLRAASPILP